MRFIGLEGLLCACVMAFRPIDSAVMSVDVVNLGELTTTPAHNRMHIIIKITCKHKHLHYHNNSRVYTFIFHSHTPTGLLYICINMALFYF